MCFTVGYGRVHSHPGLFGLKPPFGRVPIATSDWTHESNGPLAIARTFDDLVHTRALIGPHPEVHSSLRPAFDLPLRTIRSLRG
jgi:hypothetical protein